LFGGYSFTWGDKNDLAGWKDKRDKMCRSWTFATDDLAASYGLVAHAPYEDQEVMVDWAINETERIDCIADAEDNADDDRGHHGCQIQLLLGQPYYLHTTGKVLLRESFRTGSSWRRKDPIEKGSGATVIGHDEYWTKPPHNISDEEFQTEQLKLKEEHDVIIHSKEYLVNIRIYQQVFGGIVHPTKKRLLLEGEKEGGCVQCCFELETPNSMFCHMCGAYPAQRWKVAELLEEEQAKKKKEKENEEDGNKEGEE
jgi:hypothetical protein